MSEKPILFSGPMVRAILDGRKTQTRRVVKPQPEFGVSGCAYSKTGWAMNGHDGGCRCSAAPVSCPYDADRLWVRETFQHDADEYDYSLSSSVPFYRGAGTVYRADCGEGTDHPHGWKPAIFMPREFSRLTLEVTAVRVERVQDISEADAIAEGLVSWRGNDGCELYYGIQHADVWETDPRKTYARLWDTINGKTYPWALNPWVWVVEFKRVEVSK